MRSIQQVTEKFISSVMAIDFCEGLTKGLTEMETLMKEFGRIVSEYKLTEIDEAIFTSGRMRKNWVVEHKDVPRDLLTQFGTLQFCRRYYRNKKSGEYKYLVDDLVGIERGERVETGLAIKLCETATDISYAKSAKICCEGELSRQTVMRKTRKVSGCKLEEPDVREDVQVIHIQADEDHVAMQDGRRDTIVKLAVIHEPAQQIGKKRFKLPHRHLMSSYNEPVEDFWLRVADELYRRYKDLSRLKIYIHGDGAGWIRSGTKWISNSYFVMDKYHVKKMVRQVTGGDESYMQYIWDWFRTDDRKSINGLAKACIAEGICAERAGTDFISYIRNNWDGIQIWYSPKHEAGGSCAEGLVSHVLSSRLSSRPCGWRDEGLETISRLRVYVLNGGRIRPENIKKPYKPVIRATQTFKKAVGLGEYDISNALHTEHRSSSQYRMFKAITEGGYSF